MTNKQLKRMSRSELLQLLLFQSEENERLKKELDQANAKLNDKMITCENVGSIAEAALQLNGVFEAAEKAAQQYMANVRELESHQDTLYQKLEQEARAKADAIVAQANAYQEKTAKEADSYQERVKKEADDYLENVKKEADAYKANTVKEAEEYWAKVQNMVNNLMKEHQSLTALLRTNGRK